MQCLLTLKNMLEILIEIFEIMHLHAAFLSKYKALSQEKYPILSYYKDFP